MSLLKNLRKRHNLTQKELADKLGYRKKQYYVSFVESGRLKITMDLALKLNEVFNIPFAKIMKAYEESKVIVDERNKKKSKEANGRKQPKRKGIELAS